KKQQVIDLGRLGSPLRRIQQATGVRRETASAYLEAAGIGVRPLGAWGRRPASKPATSDMGVSKTGQRGDHRLWRGKTGLYCAQRPSSATRPRDNLPTEHDKTGPRNLTADSGRP